MSISLIILLLSLVLIPSCTSQAPIHLPLSLHPSSRHLPLADLAVSSLRRARHLKNPAVHAPLSSHSYGGYSITLSFGTPPQPIPLLLDTGSPLPWVPCTRSYLCRNCPSPPTFIPKSSSTAKLIGCLNPKCSWIHSPLRCPPNSTSSLCPPYLLLYGSGSTAGLLLSETLSVTSLSFPNLAVGCSLVSDSQPSGGVAGFGRGRVSLPSQLNLSRFSYCLVSRLLDDSPSASGSLSLGGPKLDSSDSLSFSPFLPNPSLNDVFSDYYYVGLNRITVGGVKVGVPSGFFAAGGDGNGGVIIDSGTTFTYMEPAAFGPLVEAFAGQVKFGRDKAAEERTGLRPCFQLPAGGNRGMGAGLPELAFHFKGGAEMRLPLENYFAFVGNTTDVVCLTVVTDDGNGGGAGPSGPSMILGNFQQQNYYVVYDLEREKLGFRRQKSCVGPGP